MRYIYHTVDVEEGKAIEMPQGSIIVRHQWYLGDNTMAQLAYLEPEEAVVQK